ncbi:hypothetical protein [Legionella geestiana]|uniref:hypothetical protein n=1 Tax=Legionella geestiana TaxID=45065 RepID=UPI00165234AC|nr:hypothetical protein [Legionella geestiana]
MNRGNKQKMTSLHLLRTDLCANNPLKEPDTGALRESDCKRHKTMTKFSLEAAKARSKQLHEEIRQRIFADPRTKSLYEKKKREIELAIAQRGAR